MAETTERQPLSAMEYYSLRLIFGLVSGLDTHAHDLERRLKTIDGGWRDWRMLLTVGEKLMRKILATVPEKKLRMISLELKHTTCEVKVHGPSDADPNMYTYVPQAEMDRVCGKAVEAECYMCEKLGGNARACQLRKDIMSLYMFDLPKIQNKQPCYFAGRSIDSIREEGKP